MPLWVPLFDLMGNCGLGVFLVSVILTAMRPVMEKLEDSSH